jgi:uncharacterized LabA/DUF88 family protein
MPGEFLNVPGMTRSRIALLIDADNAPATALDAILDDYTPLVMHLRERGVNVYGYGERKTPEPFVNACTRFVWADKLVAAVETDQGERPAPPKPTTNKLNGDAGLVTLLRKAVTAAADESGWARVDAVGQHIRNQSSFDQRNYGFGSLGKLLKATDLFQMRAEATPAISVRDKRLAKSA